MRLLPCLVIVLLAAAGAVRSAEAYQAWHERTAMLLIAQHCKALDRLEQAALLSGQVQARGALLRSGKDPETLDTVQDDLMRRAQNLSCANDKVQNEIARMHDAARLWAHLVDMRFPGRWQSWTARRDDARSKPRWRVRTSLQGPGNDTLDFGLVASGAQLFLALATPADVPPSQVVLLMRDPQKLAQPMAPELMRLMRRNGGRLASLMPPPSVLQGFVAVQKLPAPDSLVMDAEGRVHKAVLFRFSAAALRAFSALDPRDVAALKLHYSKRSGIRPRQQMVYVERADFNAARLFAETTAGDLDKAPVAFDAAGSALQK